MAIDDTIIIRPSSPPRREDRHRSGVGPTVVPAVVLAFLSVLLVGAPAGAVFSAERTFTYTVTTAGPVSADVNEFAARAADSLADVRGWSLGGRVRFQQVLSGGQFTLVLADPSTMNGFSPECSANWSCTVGSNVVINEANWRNGVPDRPGSLTDYRHYVINHEVGHFLGLGHVACPAAGAAAPVMMQQSKGLNGCVATTWPLDNERQAAARRLGLSLSGRNPVGDVNAWALRRNQVTVVGWALDPDVLGPVQVQLQADGLTFAEETAEVDRPDVAAVYGAYGAAHGFDITAPVPFGTQVVCAWALDATGDDPVRLGCRRATESPVGAVDTASVIPGGVTISGWALDGDTTDPIDVHVWGDGRFLGTVVADGSRPDIGAAYPGFGNAHGFRFQSADRVGELCAFAIDHDGDGYAALGCVTLDHQPFGHLDGVLGSDTGVAVFGWAIDPDTTAPIPVHLYAGDQFVTAVTADRPRPDVGQAYPAYGADHGYEHVINGPIAIPVCAYAIDDDGEGFRLLGCGS